MSTRGINFLDKWMAEQAMRAAEKEGISAEEISEEVGSVFEVMLEAIAEPGRQEA